MMHSRLRRKGPKFGGNGWLLLLILAILGVCIWVMTPSGSSVLHREEGNLGLRLGLDLQGGTHVVYKGVFDDSVDNWTDQRKKDAMEAAIKAIKKRVDEFGVVEPVVRKLGEESIDIQLPGVGVDEALSLIQKMANLEFREVEWTGSKVATLGDYVDGNRTSYFDTSVPGTRNFYSTTDGELVAILTISDGNPVYTDLDGEVLNRTDLAGSTAQGWMPALGKDSSGQKVPLTGAYLKSAERSATETDIGTYEFGVKIDWNSDGWKIFNDIAARLNPYYSASSVNPRCLLGIVLDNELISSPQMEEAKYTESARITGNFDARTSRELAIQLTSGALPMPLEITYGPEGVSATLGKEFTNRAFTAILIGLLTVGLFMILYYRLPGVVAAVALVIYAIILLAIYKAIPVTLTLAGVAGFIVSLGMAVDANVLIFERMKEELRAGRTMKAAVDAGFNRAWPAIRDSNITTIIACGILYWFGSSIPTATVVMGFATTLFFGVAISMFSAIVISKTLLMLLAGSGLAKRMALFGVEPRAETKNA